MALPCLLLLLFLLSSSAEFQPSNSSFDLPQLKGSLTVSKDGKGNYTSIGEAISSVPRDGGGGDGYFAIFIHEGIYNEAISVSEKMKNLLLVGAGVGRTIITGNRSVEEGWRTFDTATFAVEGQNFIATDITFDNTAGPQKHQAVAVRNSADTSIFYRCSFLGYQDTLYVHQGHQFYRDCDIYGTIDFIFGDASAVFQNCNINVRRPLANQSNVITAQGRKDSKSLTGISFLNCTIKAAPEFAKNRGDTRTFLGRPWKLYARVVYIQCLMEDLIDPLGWLEWNGSFALTTLYFGEFSNRGPGANPSHRVNWTTYHLMDKKTALRYTLYNFIKGQDWVPQNNVPHFGGLL